MKHCAECHGKSMTGDGPKADELENPPSDLTDLHIKYNNDSYLYEQIALGQEGMPTWKKKIGSKEIWAIAFFIRTKNKNLKQLKK